MDIVERLRQAFVGKPEADYYVQNCEAADEIERLREALNKWWAYSQTDYDDHIQMMIDWDDAVTSTCSALQQKESE